MWESNGIRVQLQARERKTNTDQPSSHSRTNLKQTRPSFLATNVRLTGALVCQSFRGQEQSPIQDDVNGGPLICKLTVMNLIKVLHPF